MILAQYLDLALSFTAEVNGTNHQLESIKIMNRSQDCDTVNYWVDSVLVLRPSAGQADNLESKKNLKLYQNYPNTPI